MNSSPTTWLLAIPFLLLLLFYFAALIFVFSRRSDRRSAKKFAVVGISLLLFELVLEPAFSVVFLNYGSIDDFGLYHGFYGILAAGLHILALSLLIAAAFVGPSPDLQPGSLDKLTPTSSDNPYLPPPS